MYKTLFFFFFLVTQNLTLHPIITGYIFIMREISVIWCVKHCFGNKFIVDLLLKLKFI